MRRFPRQATRFPTCSAHALAFGVCAVLAGCAREVERPGQLIVALDTDMALPQQIDTIHVQVERKGKIEFKNEYPVWPGGDAQLPATKVFYRYGYTPDPLTIRVVGSKMKGSGREFRTYREITTRIPEGQLKTVRMPIQWLCKGTAEPAASSGMDTDVEVESTCGPGNACRAGECVPTPVDAHTLEDYAARDIFGGGDAPEAGSCFDTVGCMMLGSVVEPDTDCQIAKPNSELERINVALLVHDDGICDSAGINCFVPLNGESVEGWRVSEFDGGRLQLPQAACRKLQEGKVRSVQLSTACETKTERVPACGPWSNVPKGRPGEYRPDGEVMPRVAQVTQLTLENGADPCCPLMSDANKLYACVCLRQSATLYAIEPNAAAVPRVVTSFNPAMVPNAPLATAVVEDWLYWAADRQIRRSPLAGNQQPATTIDIPGTPYQSGTLLVDDSGVYALVNEVSGGASVRLVHVNRALESAQSFELAGNGPVFQFDHDSEAVYLAIDQDDKRRGDVIERRSSVVRIRKSDGQRTLLMPERTLRTPDLFNQGGYLGVQAGQGSVFALFESEPMDDGRTELRVLETSASGEDAEARTIYSMPSDPARTRLRLLGTSDGAVLLARLDIRDNVVDGALVLAILKDRSAPRVIAEFARDQPLPGLTSDDARVYWLNGSGKVFGLPRALLR